MLAATSEDFNRAVTVWRVFGLSRIKNLQMQLAIEKIVEEEDVVK